MSARPSTFARIGEVVAGEARQRADAPATALRQYANSRIINTTDDPRGIILEVGPIGHRAALNRLVLIEGATRVTDITPRRTAWTDEDEAQHQDDIGDLIAEREREDRE